MRPMVSLLQTLTLSLFSHALAAACEYGWTAAPREFDGVPTTNFSSKCYRNAGWAQTLHECLEMCGTGASPTCPETLLESRFVATHALTSLYGYYWLGWHQYGGEAHCVSSNAELSAELVPVLPSTTGLDIGPEGSAPCVSTIAQQSRLATAPPGLWHAVPCHWRGTSRVEACICEKGSTPANVTAFLENIATLEAPADEFIVTLRAIAARRFALVLPVALLPSLFLLPWLAVSRMRRRAAVARSAAMAPPRSADGSQLPMSERSATKSQLAAASRAASGVKLRVSGGLFQLGWLMFVLGATGTFHLDEEFARARMTTVADGWFVWAIVMLMGLPTMALAARSDMVIVIRVMSVVAFVCFLLLFLVYSFLSVVGTIRNPSTIVVFLNVGLPAMIAMDAGVAVTARTICCSCCGSARVMPPRLALRRVWLARRRGGRTGATSSCARRERSSASSCSTSRPSSSSATTPTRSAPPTARSTARAGARAPRCSSPSSSGSTTTWCAGSTTRASPRRRRRTTGRASRPICATRAAIRE